MILGNYPTITASDQKIFTESLIRLLAYYPQAVIEKAANPVSGIPAQLAFLSIAEIKKHLDRWHGEHLDRIRLQQHGRRLEPPAPPPASAEAKARVQAKADEVRRILGGSLRTPDVEREQRWKQAEARLQAREAPTP